MFNFSAQGSKEWFDEIDGFSSDEAARKYLIFSVAEFVLAVDISYLKKVYDAESHPPRTPDSKVIDLYRMTGTDKQRKTGYWLDMDFSGGHFLVPVENVEGISELGLAVPVDYPSAIAGRRTGFIKKILFDGMRMIAEISPEGISETPVERPGFGRKKKAPSFGGTSSGKAEQKEQTEDVARRQDDNGDGKKLLFLSRGAKWTINLEHVFQVINMNDIFEIPSAPDEIMGAIYHSEKAIPVLKPETIIKGQGKQWGTDEDFSIIILVPTPRGAVGIPCERILQVLDSKSADEDQGGHGEVVKLSPAHILEVAGRD